MKFFKIIRVTTLAILISLSVLAHPVAPVSAAAQVTLSPARGVVGDSVVIQCTGLKRTPGLKVYFYFSNVKADVGDDIENDVGVYNMVRERVIQEDRTVHNAGFEVPGELTEGVYAAKVLPGYHYVYAVYEKSVGEDVPGTEIAAVGVFVVRGIILDTTEGIVGSGVKIQGYGFTQLSSIDVEFGNTGINIIDGDTQTDLLGDSRGTTVSIPESPAGVRAIKVTVGTEEASAVFTVKPALTADKSSGVPGDFITVKGSSFGKDANISITFGDVAAGTASANELGSFSQALEIPAAGAGALSLIARDDDGNEAQTNFDVGAVATVSVNPVTSQTSPGHAGMDITISGTGFKANAPITITYDDPPVAVAAATSSAGGDFTATFKIPESLAGENIISAGDGTKTGEIPFHMEATAPATPTLVLPEAGARTETQPLFSWEAVTDPSGVTYTLQVSLDQSFSAASIVVENKGLSHTLTVGEALPRSDSPYYWRVKAVDGASNESAWSAARAFRVGPAFPLPNWALYSLIGIAVLALLGVGYWLYRRRT